MYQGGNLEVIGSREHEETVAHNLFAVLRDFDARKVDCIFSESFSKGPARPGDHEPPVQGSRISYCEHIKIAGRPALACAWLQ